MWERLNTRGWGDRLSTISLLGRSTSVALAMGPTNEEEEFNNILDKVSIKE